MRRLLLICLAYLCSAEFLEETKPSFYDVEGNNVLPQKIKDYTEALVIENNLENIDRLANEAETSEIAESIQITYNEITDIIKELRNLFENRKNIDTFFNLNGIERVINKLIGINNESLKEHLLVLLKTLYNNALTSTTEVVPITIVDRLLDIFEFDNNLRLKAHALDVMSIWLPNNPEVQGRVMKLKGLELFYDQITKLDANVVYTSLNLFNRILKEHVLARNTLENRDLSRIKLYQKIGLIERMATPNVCNGILNIFQAILPVTDEKQLTIMFDLIKNIKPFCLKFYKGNNRAKIVFEELQRYFIDPAKIVLLSNLSFNLTDVKILLENYINVNESVKDEL